MEILGENCKYTFVCFLVSMSFGDYVEEFIIPHN